MNTENLSEFSYKLISAVQDACEKKPQNEEHKELYLSLMERTVISKLEKLDDDEFSYVLMADFGNDRGNFMITCAREELAHITSYILNRCESSEELKVIPTLKVLYENSLISCLKENQKFCSKILLYRLYDFETSAIFDSINLKEDKQGN